MFHVEQCLANERWDVISIRSTWNKFCLAGLQSQKVFHMGQTVIRGQIPASN